MVWDWIIASYLFLAGMGAGAFALAALASFVKPELKKLRMAGYVIAPVAVVVGCVMLMVDAKGGLFDPLRFFFIVSNLQSVMSWGVIILCLFILVSVVALVVMLKKGSTPKALDAVGVALSVCVAAYTGVLLGAAPAYPLWHPVVLPLLFVVSAASSGFAAVLLVTHLRGSHEPSQLGLLKKTGIALPVLETVLVAVLFAVASATTGSAAEVALASVTNMLSGSYAVAFWVGFVVVGLAVPLAIEVPHRRRDADAEEGSRDGLAIVGEACVLVGAFMLRYLVIMAAVPMFGALV